MSRSKKEKTTITFQSPGAIPPVFVSAAFTDPPWHPIELDYSKAPGSDEDLIFAKGFEVDEGRWQYKFRLGPGDWWVCNEDSEIGTWKES